ncbi:MULTISPECIES: hypothetical protein [Sphingobacterium]|uniref:hypothetical protein n=1 Tax=Sphingobacterium TaxID=28453 RepID=UPI0013DB91D8|nr:MULTISPECIES: hypothetical protein [unclassified Sphingobacterium]
MEQAVINRNIKIIKSVEAPNKLTHTEVVFGEYSDDEEVLKALKELEYRYSESPIYERLHGLEDHLSISFRHRYSQEVVRYATED